jgi:hypothetical protein
MPIRYAPKIRRMRHPAALRLWLIRPGAGRTSLAILVT